MKPAKSKKPPKNSLPPEQHAALLETLRDRFEKNIDRHEGVEWELVEAKLEARPEKLWSLHQMETTGGEPDVIGRDEESGEYLFVDCSPQTPKGRTSICFDPAALESRKEHKPKHSALGMAAEMGIEILSEKQYRELQQLGEFDTKTSSWVVTPADIRDKGGALFCDRRFGHVFLYHNGAESYYAVRGFRGMLRV